jgi:exonuclease III
VPRGRTVDQWHYRYKLTFLDALAGRIRRWLAEGTHVVVAGSTPRGSTTPNGAATVRRTTLGRRRMLN